MFDSYSRVQKINETPVREEFVPIISSPDFVIGTESLPANIAFGLNYSDDNNCNSIEIVYHKMHYSHMREILQGNKYIYIQYMNNTNILE